MVVEKLEWTPVGKRHARARRLGGGEGASENGDKQLNPRLPGTLKEPMLLLLLNPIFFLQAPHSLFF